MVSWPKHPPHPDDLLTYASYRLGPVDFARLFFYTPQSAMIEVGRHLYSIRPLKYESD